MSKKKKSYSYCLVKWCRRLSFTKVDFLSLFPDKPGAELTACERRGTERQNSLNLSHPSLSLTSASFSFLFIPSLSLFCSGSAQVLSPWWRCVCLGGPSRPQRLAQNRRPIWIGVAYEFCPPDPTPVGSTMPAFRPLHCLLQTGSPWTSDSLA